jgi:3-hydroxyisobutyrate dehydrogenase-like beta-hydroxyacid dehydrogenase
MAGIGGANGRNAEKLGYLGLGMMGFPMTRRLVNACACRKSNPDILVVQPAENWAAKNVPGPLDGARDRRILLQG